MSNLDRIRQWARLVAAGAAALFIVDLFLAWQRTDVRVTGMVHVDHMASGWNGWGLLAGLCAAALLVVVLADRSLTSAAAGLAVAMLVFAGLAVVTGDSHVNMHMSSAAVDVDTVRWPAWAGLGLAAVAALATAVPFLADRERHAAPMAPHGSG